MKRQAFQHPELRDANDNIIQAGTYGKESPLVNSDNTGVLDYINNNLEALHDNINGARIYVANKAALPATGDLSAMYIAEDTGKWYLWDGSKYIETDNARKIADEAIAARDAAKASAKAAADSARVNQADWNVTDTTNQAYIKNKPAVYPRANLLDPRLNPSNRVTTMNTSYGDSTLRYFNATTAIVDGTKEIPDAHILQMAWDNGKACDAQLAITTGSKNIPGSMYFRTQNNDWATIGWHPWKEVACKDDTIARATADANGNPIASTYLPAVVGAVVAFAGRTTPQGWLLCDGSAVSRTDYAALYAVIGTTYGAGNGSTTFNLPNLVDKFVEGSATAGTVKSAGLPNITGAVRPIWDGSTGATPSMDGSGAFARKKTGNIDYYISRDSYGSNSNGSYTANFDASRSSAIYGNSTTVQPPALTMRYIIKY